MFPSIPTVETVGYKWFLSQRFYENTEWQKISFMIERISTYHKKFFGGIEWLAFCLSGRYEYLFCGNDNGFQRGVFVTICFVDRED